MITKMIKIISATGISTVLVANVALADPINILTTLTGDPRPGNPDNLFVELTIAGDTGNNYTDWTVDINSPLHPNIKLDAFFFNLDVSTGVTFSLLNPTGWEVTSPANNAQGSGSANFEYAADKSTGGGPPPADVTNATNLTFRATLASGAWTEDMFYGAAYATSSNSLLGSFQVGAHLQGLTVPSGSNMSDSGFATANYNGVAPVPEPATMLLFGTGLVGLVGSRLRKKKK